jgi:hypothetical protein
MKCDLATHINLSLAIFEDILIDFNHPAGLGIAIVTLVLG